MKNFRRQPAPASPPQGELSAARRHDALISRLQR
jgi:hypothetical protein